MLSKRERAVWISAIMIAISLNFFLTSNLQKPLQDLNNEGSTPEAFTDIEKEAEQWFTSDIQWPSPTYPPLPKRYRYTQWENIEAPLTIYQGYVERDEPWIKYPEQIVLKVFFPPPEIEGFVPDKVSIYYYNKDIVIIKVMLASPYKMTEMRFDLVRVDNIWKIVWVGERSISLQ
jgi:hypothetical protein